MIRQVVVALAFLFSVSPATAAKAPSAIPLKLAAFSAGFHNCSRPVPQGMTSYWQVSPSDMAKVDQSLLQYLEITGLTKRLRKPPSAFGRQYVGFSRGNRRFIYVNAYLKATGDTKSTYVRRCEAGNQTWGIEYDLQQQLFANFDMDTPPTDPLDGIKI
jgi:hypothetical protein